MSDSCNILKCPACQKEMKKVFVPGNEVNIDICADGCGGIWFDNREMKLFDEQVESIDEILAAIDGKTFEKVDQTNYRSCPSCGARMAKNYTSPKKNIQIDECYACGGKFLDNSELQAMRAEYETEADRSKDMIEYTYQTVGVKIEALREESAELEKRRSPIKKLFDKLIGGGSSKI